MSRFLNESDIKAQLINACIVLPDDLENLLGAGFKRAKTDTDTGKTESSTILVYEFPLRTGGSLFCGGYQNFKIHDTFQKFSIERGIEISKEDRLEHQKQQRENQKLAAVQQKKKASESALRASVMFKEADQVTCGDYLTEKMIDAPYGTRCGEKGRTFIPMYDGDWKIWGVQTVFSKSQEHEQIKRLGRNKTFMAGVQKRGKFFSTGRIPTRGVVAVGEGVSTMLTIKMAMPELTCIAAFDAGNLPVVVADLHKRNSKLQILICGDDDFMCRCKHCMKQTEVADADGITTACKHCGESHGKVNVGKNAATKALNASSGRGAIVFPAFESYQDKKSDFNDIITLEKLPIMVVAKQIQDAMAPFDLLTGDASPARDAQTGGAGKAGALRLLSVDESVRRYVLIYGVKDTMFDRGLLKLVPKSCVMDITRGRAWDEIKTHPEFKVVDIDNVGFDASEKDPDVVLNMFGGFESVPCDKGSCDAINEVIDHLVAGEDAPRKVRHELICYLAYPLQYPGTKIDWSLVLHGEQGGGKSIVFEKVMIPIYGKKYATLIGQEALDDKFNEWASKRLFVVADEVVARQELYHTKNVLKKYITGKYIPINPKNVAKYTECNQMNFVFLSNEDKPVVLEARDRRYLVIRTPDVIPPKALFQRLGDELEQGGIAAFHHYLLQYDCKDFNPHANPIMTYSKEDLMNLCKEPPIQFVDEWLDKALDLPPICCLLDDLYQCFRRWCDRSGERFIPTKRSFSSQLQSHPDVQTGRKAKKSVMQPDGKLKPMNVVLTVSDPKPDEKTWSEFLSPQIQTFKTAMGDF